MNPSCTPQQIKSRLGITWADWRHLNKTCPPPRNLATLDDPRFDEWARRNISGLLIQNMRVRRGLPPAILPPLEKRPVLHKPIPSVYKIFRELITESPMYGACLLGYDEGNYSLIGATIEPLGDGKAACRELRARLDQILALRAQRAERKAA